MTESDKEKGIVYSENYDTLLEVPNQENIVISNLCLTIFGTKNNYAFLKSKDTLKSFSFMPNPALKTIQSYAFYECKHLEEIDLRTCSKLESIEEYAFASCSLATNLYLPDGKLTAIKNRAFKGSGITSLELPTTVETIESAFCESQVSQVTFIEPSSLKSILYDAFSYTKITSFNIPSSLEIFNGAGLANTKITTVTINDTNTHFAVDDNVLYTEDRKTLLFFPQCGRTSFTIPNTVTSIGNYAFAWSEITSVTLPPNIEVLRDSAFYYSKITSIEFPTTIKNIGNACFGYSSIKSAVFKEPSKLTDIGNYALSTSSLTSVILPSSIKSLGGGVFYLCPSNIDIKFAEGSEFAFDKVNFMIVTKDNKKVTNYVGSDKTVNIPESTEVIGIHSFQGLSIEKIVFKGNKVHTIEMGAFSNCPFLTSITIPQTVHTIENNAFNNSGITSIELNAIKSIGSNVFSFCPNLKQVTIGSISKIPSYCFKGCINLTTFTVTNNAFTSIGTEAFKECRKLSQFDFPSTLEKGGLGAGAFEGSGLTSVTISSDIGSIRDYTFNNCNSLIHVSLPETINTIGINAFYNTSIDSFVVPNSVVNLSYYCLSMCSKLERFEIQRESQLTNIQEKALFGCTSLAEIVCNSKNFVVENNALFNKDRETLIVFAPASNITVFCFPQTVRNVQAGAFSCAKNLVIITIPDDSLTVIGPNTFENCTKLRNINIPACINGVGSDAFVNCDSIQCGQEINKPKEFIQKLITNAKFPKRGLKTCINVCSVQRQKLYCPSIFSLIFTVLIFN